MSDDLKIPPMAADKAASYIGSATAIVSSLTLTDIGILVGIFTAIGTFIFSWVYQHRKDRRDQREHEARMAQLAAEEGGE